MRDGDVLMVDKSTEPKAGKVVIAAINGEMTVKRLSVVDGQMTLTADNPNYPEVKVGDFNDLGLISGSLLPTGWNSFSMGGNFFPHEWKHFFCWSFLERGLLYDNALFYQQD